MEGEEVTSGQVPTEPKVLENESSPPSLSVMCPICNEFFKETDMINSTSCGHIFHKNCLTRWLNRSRSCPQCRSECHHDRVHRIFLNFTAPVISPENFVPLPRPPYEWVPIYLGDEDNEASPQVFEGSVQCGTDEDGHPAYVARMTFGRDLLPASYIPEKGVARGSWGCRAYTRTQDVEVLVLNNCDHKWVPGQNGSYPEKSLKTGHSEIGHPTFTGRCIYEGILRLGKVHPSHKLMYLPHGDLEVSTDTYEVLVVKPRNSNDH
ncbi:hypothetical protein KR067_007292 [Drosophila pandora]|nr:hypothetical protein KR067_007292 [Drosophila pandora]